MVHRACLRTRSGAGSRGPAPDELPAVFTQTATGFLLGRAGDGETPGTSREQLTGIVRKSKGFDHETE